MWKYVLYMARNIDHLVVGKIKHIYVTKFISPTVNTCIKNSRLHLNLLKHICIWIECVPSQVLRSTSKILTFIFNEARWTEMVILTVIKLCAEHSKTQRKYLQYIMVIITIVILNSTHRHCCLLHKLPSIRSHAYSIHFNVAYRGSYVPDWTLTEDLHCQY